MVLLRGPEETGLEQQVQKIALSGGVSEGADCSWSAQTNNQGVFCVCHQVLDKEPACVQESQEYKLQGRGDKSLPCSLLTNVLATKHLCYYQRFVDLEGVLLGGGPEWVWCL